jgi:hypothetical protein
MTNGACDLTRARLSAFLDDDLGPEDAAEVRRHLDACAPCRSEFNLLRLTVGALRRLPDLPAPAGILSGVRARLAPEPWHRRVLRRASRNWLVGVPVGAVATLLVLAAAALFQARFPEIRREAATPAVTVTRQEVPASAPPAAIVELPPPQAPPPPAQPAVVPVAPSATVKRKAEAASAESAPSARVGAKHADISPGEQKSAPNAEAAPAQEPPQSFAARERVDAAGEVLEAVGATKQGRPTTGGSYADDLRRVGADTTQAEKARPAATRRTGEPSSWAKRAPAPSGTPSVGRSRAPTEEKAAKEQVGAPPAGDEEAAREPLEVLYVWSQDGDDVEELRRIIRREGGSLLQVRVMDSRTGRAALVPVQQQMIPTSNRVRNAWEIQARVPRRNMDRILRDVERRPGYQLLQRQPAELPQGPPTEHQDLKIRVFR